MGSSPDLVEIAIHEDAWLTLLPVEKWHTLFERCYHLVLSQEPATHIQGCVSVCLTNNEEMTNLNMQYRQKPHPTNVLSFSQEAEGILGDIVLSHEIIQEEATQQDKTFIDHVTHLFIHGLLHLSGYDHETPEESQVMENLEIEALKTLKIGNPYA